MEPAHIGRIIDAVLIVRVGAQQAAGVIGDRDNAALMIGHQEPALAGVHRAAVIPDERIIGVCIGALILMQLTDLKTFSLVFGIVVGVAVLMTAIGWHLAFNTGNLLSMSAISGIMGIITSVGAPPMALIYSQRPAQEARPTLAAFFAVGCALSILGLIIMGWSSWRDLWLAGLMVPGVLLGTAIARRFQDRFDKRYKPALLGVAGTACLLLIARGLS